MTIKNAAFLAFLSTLLLSILMLWRLVMDILNIMSDLIPAVTFVSSFLYAFAAVAARSSSTPSKAKANVEHRVLRLLA